MKFLLFILSLTVYTSSFAICGKLTQSHNGNFRLNKYEVRVDDKSGPDREFQLKKQLKEFMKPSGWNGQVCFKGFANAYHRTDRGLERNYFGERYILYSDESDIVGDY